MPSATRVAEPGGGLRVAEDDGAGRGASPSSSRTRRPSRSPAPYTTAGPLRYVLAEHVRDQQMRPLGVAAQGQTQQLRAARRRRTSSTPSRSATQLPDHTRRRSAHALVQSSSTPTPSASRRSIRHCRSCSCPPDRSGREQLHEADVLAGHPERPRRAAGSARPRRGAASPRSSCSCTRSAAPRRRRARAAGCPAASLNSSWLTTDRACTGSTCEGWMQVLPSRPLARSSSISRSSPSMSCSMSAVRSSSARSEEGAAAQLRLEHPLLEPEVLPHRTGDREAGAVGPAQHVHHVGDDGGDDLDVVRGHVGRPAQPVGGAEVGDAEPQRQHPLAVLVDGAGDARRGSRRGSPGAAARATPGRASRTAAARSPPRPSARASRNGMPRSSVNFGSTNPDSSRTAGPSRAHQVGDLLGRRGPGRTAAAAPAPAPRSARSANCRTRFSSAAATSASSMESSRHSTIETTPRPACLRMSSASRGPGGGAVERGAQGRGEHAGRGVGGELARLLVEEALPHLGRDVPEMTHDDSPVLPSRGPAGRQVAGNSTYETPVSRVPASA